MTSHQRWRKKYPMKAAYHTLKYNARRRGKEFTLTFAEFEQFAIETKLLTKRGVKSSSYTVDRIDSSKGYTIDNIQVLPKGVNCRKSMIERYYQFVEDPNGGQLIIINKSTGEPEEHPF